MTRKYNTSGPNFRVAKVCKECGSNFLGTNNSKYCSVTCLQRNDYAANMLKPEWRLNKLLAAAKNRAKVKGLDFNIDIEYLKELWTVNNERCQITGRVFDLTSYGKSGQVNPNAPSIDRVVPEIGYVKGNVRLVTYHVNVALSEYGLESLRTLASDILNKR